jgi:hypothetical protein
MCPSSMIAIAAEIHAHRDGHREAESGDDTVGDRVGGAPPREAGLS